MRGRHVRGLVLEATGRIAFREDIAEPDLLDPRDAVVAVTAAGLCGSDLHPYEGREAVRFGVVQGHEIVGEVLSVGSAVTAFKRGDRVLASFTTSCGLCDFCRRGLSARCVSGELFGYGPPDGARPPLQGGQAERVRVPLADSTLVAVPPAVTDAEAVLLTDNLPTAWYAAQRADITPGASVAVVGLGSVGLLALAAARSAGAGSVVAVDPVEDRRRRAAALGATTVDPEAAAKMEGQFDAVVEAAGTAPAQRLAFSLLRPGGVLSLISVQTAEHFAFTPVHAYDANATIRAGRAPVRSVLEDLLPRIAAGELRIPVETVVTHPAVPLEEGPGTYRRFAAREAGLVKAYFDPQLA